MPRPKLIPKVEQVDEQVILTRVPWVAYHSDHPMLAGYTFSGATTAEAIANLKAFVARHLKVRGINAIFIIKD